MIRTPDLLIRRMDVDSDIDSLIRNHDLIRTMPLIRNTMLNRTANDETEKQFDPENRTLELNLID